VQTLCAPIERVEEPEARPAPAVEPPSPWDTVSADVFVYRERAADPIEAAAETRSTSRSAGAGGGAFTIPLICLGVGVIAMCLLVPAADEIRALAYERDRLKADLEQLERQVATNDSFLHRVANDPVLAERLARRQMKMVPQGTAVLDLKFNATATPADEMSPFLLVTVPPPAPMAPYKPVGGFLANLCRKPKTQLYLIGGSLMAIASGLVLSRSSRDADATEE
jgi:hypothetical protein